jgi:NADPH:quinone reductase-like Zn-dependent oxidoreductase
MKAIVYEKYGSPDFLEFKEVENPVPNDDEVLIKVCGASVNAFDWHVLRADPFFIRLMGFGFFKPKYKIPGADLSGKIESVGKNVKQFKPGDEVYGCGLNSFAEYVCINEKKIALRPTAISFEEAASVPMAALTALQGLRNEGKIQPGQKVLINGASGGVGTFAVQIAKYYGAEVTAVCSKKNLETSLSIGADFVIDYTKENFTKNGKQYDLIFAANGYHSIFDYKKSLGENGRYVMAGGSYSQMFQTMFLGLLITKTSNKKMSGVFAKVEQMDLEFLREIIDLGKIKPVIDRWYPLKGVPDAIRYVEKGHARGKVVITF